MMHSKNVSNNIFSLATLKRQGNSVLAGATYTTEYSSPENTVYI